MIEKTARCLEAGAENLYEASFSYEGLYCAVEILRKQGGGYAIYEVKSASHPAEIYGGSFSSTAGKARRPLTHIRKSPSAVPRRWAAEGDYWHFCCRTPINVSGSFLCGGIFISWGCSQIPDLTGQSSTPFRFLPTCRLETERTGKPALRHTRRE